MKNYLLTAKAEADLRSIIRYTRKEWGDTQTRRYIDKREQGIVSLTHGKSANTIMFFVCPGKTSHRLSLRFFMSGWIL